MPRGRASWRVSNKAAVISASTSSSSLHDANLRLNKELDLLCTVQLYSLAETPRLPSLPRNLGSYTKALLVSQDGTSLCNPQLPIIGLACTTLTLREAPHASYLQHVKYGYRYGTFEIGYR
jgi:hypothetical protein